MVSSTRQRSQPRETVRWPAVVAGDGGSEQEAMICDISPDGLFLKLDDVPWLAVGSRVEIRFVPSGAALRSLVTCGTVRWIGLSSAHGCFGAGVELDGIEPALLHYIEGAVDESSPRSSGSGDLTALNPTLWLERAVSRGL